MKKMMTKHTGFTLIELLVTLTVLAILLAIGAPNLRTFIQNSRLMSQTTELVGDLNFARAEAVKRGGAVNICASADGATCSGALTWETGWIVFNENSTPPNVALDAGDVLLRVTPALGGGNTMRAPAGRAAIRFGTQGYSLGFTTTFRACDSRGLASGRNVTVSNQGRVTTGLGGIVSCP
jgi:type IV fimbrial biogenesis protein FimT